MALADEVAEAQAALKTAADSVARIERSLEHEKARLAALCNLVRAHRSVLKKLESEAEVVSLDEYKAVKLDVVRAQQSVREIRKSASSLASELGRAEVARTKAQQKFDDLQGRLALMGRVLSFEDRHGRG